MSESSTNDMPTSNGCTQKLIFKEQSAQTVLTGIEIESKGLLPVIEGTDQKQVKKKRSRRKKHKQIGEKIDSDHSEMEEKDCKLDKSKVALKKEKRGKKSKSSNTYSNETKSNTENELQIKKAADIPQTLKKEKLFDPITNTYVRPKNNPKTLESKNNSKQTVNDKKNQTKQKGEKKGKNNDKNSFPPHYIPEMVEKGLQQGLLLEGTLRINPKCYEEGFVTNENLTEPDIFIGGLMNRNRALNGDEVIVDLLPESEWRVNYELVQEYLYKNNLDILPQNTPKPEEQNEDMIIKFKGLGVRFDKSDVNDANQSMSNERNSDSNCAALKDLTNLSMLESTQSSEISMNVTDIDIDMSFNDTDSKGLCVEIEDVEEADFDEANNHRISQTEDLKDYASASSSEEADIVVDEIVEIKPVMSPADHSTQSPNSKIPMEENSTQSIDNQTVSNNQKTRRKRGSKKKANTEDGKKHLKSKNDIVNFLKQADHSILLRGIPFTSTEQDIINFLGEESNFVQQGILIPRSSDGQSSGQAYVQFGKSEDVKNALKKNKQSMGNRYIEIFEGKDILQKLLPRSNTKPSTVKTAPEFTIAQIMLAFPESWKKFAQKTGRIVAIREMKHSRSAVGHIADRPGDDKWALFKPTDSRVPRMLIARANCPPGFWKRQQDFENVLFVAKIVRWEMVKFALGDLTHALGDDASVENCTTGMLIENDVKTDPFSKAVTDSLPSLPFVIPSEEIKSRKDFRNECIFTIDPLTARDLDDAVSIEKMIDGNYRVGVHIADVSYFIKEETELDKEAQDRATSVYLVQKVVPMLPRQLCENLCSLNPNEDRLTFSVEWIMTSDGEIISVWFGRSVINSAVKLAYEHAQDMLEHPNKKWMNDELPPVRAPWNTDVISEKVNMLQSIAVKLRQKREASGALRLDQPKLSFALDSQSGLPQGFKMYEHRHSNRLIEEFMLLANTSVAQKLQESFPNLAVLRNHPPPKDNVMVKVLNTLEKHDIHLDSASSKTLQMSLKKYQPKFDRKNEKEDFKHKFRYQALMNIMSRPMERAKYFCSGWYTKKAEDEREGNEVIDYHHHYALNVPLYTHFTSPIRRYPDILVHRLLDAAINGHTLEWKEAIIQRIASHCNDKKLAAKRVSEASDEMFLASFIKECGDYNVEGIVLKVFDKAIDCLLFDMATVQRVYLENQVNSGMLQSYEVLKRRSQDPALKLIWGTEKETNYHARESTIDVFSIVSITLVADKDKPLKIKANLNYSS